MAPASVPAGAAFPGAGFDSFAPRAGSANTVAERIQELGEELGLGALGVNLTVGSIAENQGRENIEAFAREVMSKVRKELKSETAP